MLENDSFFFFQKNRASVASLKNPSSLILYLSNAPVCLSMRREEEFRISSRKEWELLSLILGHREKDGSWDLVSGTAYHIPTYGNTAF